MRVYRSMCMWLCFTLSILASGTTNLESLKDLDGRHVPKTRFVSPRIKAVKRQEVCEPRTLPKF